MQSQAGCKLLRTLVQSSCRPWTMLRFRLFMEVLRYPTLLYGPLLVIMVEGPDKVAQTQEPGGKSAVGQGDTTCTDSIRSAIFRAASHSHRTGNSSSTCTGGTKLNMPPAARKSSMLCQLPRCKSITAGYGPCTRFLKGAMLLRTLSHGQ